MVATHALSALLVVVYVLQFAAGVPDSILGAGLVKPLVVTGEWWRLVTACFLHGNVVHLIANVGALQIFGRIVEERASWRHLIVVYLIAGVSGSLLSQWLMAATSIGASGAVIGLVAFSLVVGYRDHKDDRRALVVHAGKVLVITGLVGAALYRTIDNAAHAGGALAGFALGFVMVRASTIRPISPFAGWLAALVLFAAASVAGTLVVRSHVPRRSLIPQVTDHSPVPEATVSVKIWPGLEGVEYAFTNIGTKGITAWEVGFYAEDGTRRVGSFGGDVCRPVQERPGWMRPGQTHVESFRRVSGESRHGLSARVDVILIDGGGFSGSPARYEAMLQGRRHRLAELDEMIATLTTAGSMTPAEAEPYLRAQIDRLAKTAEESREPLGVSELLSARREAETRPGTYTETVQRVLDRLRLSADGIRRCDVR